jgi:hypothetical protein
MVSILLIFEWILVLPKIWQVLLLANVALRL